MVAHDGMISSAVSLTLSCRMKSTASKATITLLSTTSARSDTTSRTRTPRLAQPRTLSPVSPMESSWLRATHASLQVTERHTSSVQNNQSKGTIMECMSHRTSSATSRSLAHRRVVRGIRVSTATATVASSLVASRLIASRLVATLLVASLLTT